MPLIDRNREPTPKDLRVFGLTLALFLGVVGVLVGNRTGQWTIPIVVWSAALIQCALYYLIPSVQAMVFRAWITALFPIGWVISYTLLAAIYYLIVTPIGLFMRLLGRDPLQRQLDHTTESYWAPYIGAEKRSRYFQQF